MKFILNIACVGIVLLAISCTNHNKASDDAKNYSMESALKAEKSKNSLLQDLVIAKSLINNESISKSLSFVNFKGDTIAFKDYVGKSRILVLYAGSKFCSSCFEKELSMLSDFATKNKNLKILVLARNIGVRKLIVEKKRKNYEFNIGIIPNSSSMNKSIEEMDMPIYFLADEKLQIINPYISYKQMLELTKRYLQAISSVEFKRGY